MTKELETNNVTEKRERKYWMDLARIIASFAVIIIHLPKDASSASNAVSSLLHFAVPIFVMISGTNFLKPSCEITIRIMWKKYIIPLFSTFLVWSILYAIWNSYVFYKNDYFEMAKNIIINTVNGHYHLWYVWMTLAMYAIAVFIKKITDNSSNKELLYYLSVAYAYLTLKFLVQFQPLDNFASAITDIRLTFVSGFLIYFIGGSFLSRLKYERKISIIMLIWAIVSLLGNFSIVFFKITPLEGGDRFGYFSPFTIGLSFSAYWFLSRFTEKFAQKFKKIIVHISSLTLSIYMSHVFIIEIFKKSFSVEEIKIIYLIPAGIIVFVACYLLALLLSINGTICKLLNGRSKHKKSQQTASK